MRIAFYCNWYVKQTIPIANALAEFNDVTMIVPRVSGEASSNDGCIGEKRLREVVSPRVRLITLPGMQALHPLAPWALIRAAYALHSVLPDVVHLHESYDFRSLLLTKLLRRFPFVLTVHDPVPHEGERISLQPFKHWVRDRTRRAVDGLIVLSDGLRGILAQQTGVARERVFFVEHGEFMHAAAPRTWPDDGLRRILFFGRWEEYKGIDVLIRAEPLITARHPSARIVLAGAGRIRLADVSPLMVHPEQFEVLNYAIPDDEVPSLFARSEMLVLPYRQASQSGPLHIAALHGKPVVASRVGAIPESLEDGVTGLLVSPGDPEALATAVCRLLDDPAYGERLGARAKELSEGSRSAGAIAAQHLQAYTTVIHDRRLHATD